jgi:spore coat polysaccharide biosynthesis protein SpsF
MPSRIIIGIQARSTSTRLPNKVNLPIGNKSLLQHVIDKCGHAARFLNKQRNFDLEVGVSLLIPFGDPIKHCFPNMDIIEESEQDVLARYLKAWKHHNADFMVRITSDCLWIEPYAISRSIKNIVKMNYNFCTNVMYRTAIEGMDVEIMDSRAMSWLEQNAVSDYHKEHVTIAIYEAIQRREFPYSHIHILDNYDLSEEKTSIDTPEEYIEAVKKFDTLEKKKSEIIKSGGKFCI